MQAKEKTYFFTRLEISGMVSRSPRNVFSLFVTWGLMIGRSLFALSQSTITSYNVCDLREHKNASLFRDKRRQSDQKSTCACGSYQAPLQGLLQTYSSINLQQPVTYEYAIRVLQHEHRKLCEMIRLEDAPLLIFHQIMTRLKKIV